MKDPPFYLRQRNDRAPYYKTWKNIRLGQTSLVHFDASHWSCPSEDWLFVVLPGPKQNLIESCFRATKSSKMRVKLTCRDSQ